MAILGELDLTLPSDVVESIVDKVQTFLQFIIHVISLEHLDSHFYGCILQTMIEADLNGDGKIDQEEWKEFVSKNPSVIKNMTLPHLKWVQKISTSSFQI